MYFDRGEVHGCASALNVVSAPPDGAIIECWRWKRNYWSTVACQIWPWSIQGVEGGYTVFDNCQIGQICGFSPARATLYTGWNFTTDHATTPMPNLAVIGKGAWVQEPSRLEYFVKIAVFVAFLPHGRQFIPNRSRWNLAWHKMPWIHSLMSHLALIGQDCGYISPKNLKIWSKS